MLGIHETGDYNLLETGLETGDLNLVVTFGTFTYNSTAFDYGLGLITALEQI